MSPRGRGSLKISNFFDNAHDPGSLKLDVVPGCRVVQHASPNLDVTQDSVLLVRSFPVVNN